jgi:two-component system invasion response regulator UvrY
VGESGFLRAAPTGAVGRRDVRLSAADRDPGTLRGRGAAVGVLSVDDDRGFLEVARAVVQATPGFESVGVAMSGEEAVSLVPVLRPQLVLMDVRMPGIGGIEAARQIGAADGGVAVVLMSADPLLLACDRLPCGIGVIGKDRLCPAVLRALVAD